MKQTHMNILILGFVIDCVGFNDTSILVGHVVASPREKE